MLFEQDKQAFLIYLENMTISEAKQLIAPVHLSTSPQNWLDLGCGSGIFTMALAELLPTGSLVIGLDKTVQNLPSHSPNGNRIQFLQADINQELAISQAIDGIMMANSLHYIANQQAFIQKMTSYMQESAQFIVVEYDTRRANPWIPYPVPFDKLSNIFEGMKPHIMKLGERKSIYNSSNMYAAHISYEI